MLAHLLRQHATSIKPGRGVYDAAQSPRYYTIGGVISTTVAALQCHS
jgi:hypothetical protein